MRRVLIGSHGGWRVAKLMIRGRSGTCGGMSFRGGGVRRRGRRLRSRRIGNGGHGAFRIQQMVLARAEPQLDEGAGVGHLLALPAVVGLVAPHGFFTGLVPRARWFTAQVVLADQGLLNSLGSLGINLLLAADARGLFSRGAFSRCSRRRGRVGLAGGFCGGGSA